MAVPTHPLLASPLGHAVLTVGASVVTLPDVPARARRVLLRVLSAPVNFTDFPGQEPAANFGMPLLVDETLVHDGDPHVIKLIRATAVNAEVRVAYYE